jgi:Ca2+-binding RTX toxin-like protein
MAATPTVGNEFVFSTDPLAALPRVTALADDTFVLSWETATGDLFARHFDETGNFASGNFLQAVSSFGHNVFNDTLTTPLVVQESNGTVVTDFGLFNSTGDEDIGLHPVDANFTDTGGIEIPTASTAKEGLVDAVATQQGTAVSFERLEGSNFHTFVRFYGKDGAVGSSDIQIGNPGESGTQEDAALLSTGANSVDVVYTNIDPTTGAFGIRFQTILANGIKSNSIAVSGPGESAIKPDIARLTDGSVVIVWQDSASILIKHLLPSGVTDGFVRISGSEGGLLPKVTALKDGSFIVAWTNSVGTESDGSPNEDLFLRHFVLTPDGSGGNIIADIGTTIHLAEPGDQGLFQTSLTTLADGRVLIAYASETGDATNVNNMAYRILDPRDGTINGTANADVILGQQTATTINGLGDETLQTTNAAGGAAISLTGNELSQAIIGNAGANFINGGTGNDMLTGHGGADTFVFNTALSATANVDRITDFDRLVDSIRLDMSVFKALTTVGVLSDNAFFRSRGSSAS